MLIGMLLCFIKRPSNLDQGFRFSGGQILQYYIAFLASVWNSA
jgi:hypothetical protein